VEDVRLKWLGVMFLVAGATVVSLALFAVFVLDGAGSVHVEVAHYPTGRLEHVLRHVFTGSGTRVYWNADGTLDRERSHHRWFGVPVGGLSRAETDWYSSSQYLLMDSLTPIVVAVGLFVNRMDGLSGDTGWTYSAFARRERAPESLEQVFAYPASREALGDRLVVPKDPWGRDFLLSVEPDPDAPFPDAVQVTVFTRGSDGTPGGMGEAADFGFVHAWSGTWRTSEIP
jgi:hypothetical protein